MLERNAVLERNDVQGCNAVPRAERSAYRIHERIKHEERNENEYNVYNAPVENLDRTVILFHTSPSL